MATLEEIADLIRKLRDDVSGASLSGGGEYATRSELVNLASQLREELSPPMASLWFSTQSIASSLTLVTPTATAVSGATWNYGLNIDIPNSRVQIPSTPYLSRILFVAWWQWDANVTGTRILQWTDNSGNNVPDRRPALTEPGLGTWCHVTHVRRVASADTWYSIQVAQNSGGALNGDGLFVAMKVG